MLYRVQFLLGDKTLSPNSFPSLYAIALLAVDLGLGPCSSTADSVELYRAPAQTVPLDLCPLAALDHCKTLGNKDS